MSERPAGGDAPAKVPRTPARPRAGPRSAARLAAVQALYQIEMAGAGAEPVVQEFLHHRPRTEPGGVAIDRDLFADLVRGAVAEREALDRLVVGCLAPKWPFERLESVLRAILRVASYEIARRTDVPARAAINEYVELAHDFFTGREPAMVNGILDCIARATRAAEIGPMAGAGDAAALADEFALIARHFAPLAAGAPGALELTDDAALVSPRAGRTLVATVDAMVAGVHFLPGDAPELVAQKLLRVNLSDLAAMGAEPFGYLLAAILPTVTTEGWLERFAAGLKTDQDAFGVALLGGDTSATPGPLTLSLTAFGWVEEGAALTRGGARPGDLVCVSGAIGDGLLGLKVLKGEIALPADLGEAAAARYRRPEPRLALGRRLVGLAHAAIDVSDGLVADLGHVCEVSGVGAVIEAERIPLSAAGRAALAADPGLLAALITGGDDYELVFTVAPEAAARVAGLAVELDLALTGIGRIEAGAGVRVVGADGRELALAATGWRHF
ncbi:MAG: thiamine-phosphate kinase [Proteobacteria bacterium]|nr:thiamine-phosphate kinase [Pseudomonadota bacterium]